MAHLNRSMHLFETELIKKDLKRIPVKYSKVICFMWLPPYSIKNLNVVILKICIHNVYSMLSCEVRPGKSKTFFFLRSFFFFSFENNSTHLNFCKTQKLLLCDGRKRHIFQLCR